MPSFRTLAACIAAFAISTPVLQAQLNVTLDGGGDNTVTSGATTGDVEFWDSGNRSSATTTVLPADFSQSANMFLAGSPNPDQFLDGMIGEVKVYREALSPAKFSAELDLLKSRWIGASDPVLEVDAGLDTDADDIWEDTTGYGYDFHLDTANGVARVPVAGSATTLTHAYDFPGGFDQFGLPAAEGGTEGTVGGANFRSNGGGF